MRKCNNDRLVSFIIPCYRESEIQFRQSIDSVLAQTYTNLDVVIILDDPNSMELKSLGIQYSKQDERIRFFVNEQNLKLTNTLNKGLQLAKGDIIARLDSDDIASPQRIEKQMQYIDEYDLISSNFALINEDGNIIQHRKFPETDKDIKEFMLNSMDCMFHTTWLGKKSLFTQLNGYRNIGPFEDYDFLLRGINVGARYYNVQDELTQYRINLQGISQTNKALQHLGSEYLRTNIKKIEKIDAGEIEEYLNSPLGKKHLKSFDTYCNIKNKIFNAKSTRELYFLALLECPKLLFNYYGRKKILDSIKWKLKN